MRPWITLPLSRRAVSERDAQAEADALTPYRITRVLGRHAERVGRRYRTFRFRPLHLMCWQEGSW